MNTKYDSRFVFITYTSENASKIWILLAEKWRRKRYNVVNRMYGTFYWTWDIPYIINTPITMLTTEIEFKSWNIVQFFYVKKIQQ